MRCAIISGGKPLSTSFVDLVEDALIGFIIRRTGTIGRIKTLGGDARAEIARGYVGNTDTAAVEFEAQSFGQYHHRRFGRGISAPERQSGKARNGADVDNESLPARVHGGQYFLY